MAIQLDDITEIELEGNGSFDVLMRTLKLHIAQAVEDSELTQSQAGQIYTGVIPSIVQQAVQFELQKDLVAQQILTEKQNTENSRLQGLLVSRQIALAEAQTVEQLTDTGRKTNWSNKDLEVKDAEIINTARSTSKIELDMQLAERATTLQEEQLKLAKMSSVYK